MKLIAEHRLKNDRTETRQIEGWVREFASRSGLTAPVRQAIDLALEEWITNVISHAYEDQAEHWILLRMSMAADQVCLEIEDDGRAFNPLDRPPIDLSVPLEQREIGGLGLHMISKLMDAVEYRREQGRNILTLRKRNA